MSRHIASDELLARNWNGQMVVYDCYSGDTHCLDRVASAVLCSVMQYDNPDETQLLDRARSLLRDDNRLSPEVLTAALGELERLRLVRAID